MFMRWSGLVLFAGALVFSVGSLGCKKSSEPSAPPAEASKSNKLDSPLSEKVGRVHWLGKKRLSGETNAAYLMSIWNLPESARLEAQTLTKLSTAPWRFFGQTGVTNANAAATNEFPLAVLFRPLLEDLLSEESYLEMSEHTNQQIVLAIRLNDERATLWHTNLSATVQSLTGIAPTPLPDKQSGWSL